MNDISAALIGNLLANVWANAEGDRNALFKSVRLSPLSGFSGSVSLSFDNTPLPTSTVSYVTVELGSIPENKIGFSSAADSWFSLDYVANTFNNLVTCSCGGRLFNPDTSYLRFCKNGNILLAFNVLDNAQALAANTDILVHFYSNQYYTDVSHVGSLSVTTFKKLQNSTLSDYLAFTANVTSTSLIYTNGLLNSFNKTFEQLAVGDKVTLINDPSITAIKHVTLKNISGTTILPLYTSVRDSATKYIVSTDDYNKADGIPDIHFYLSIGFTAGNQPAIGLLLPRIDTKTITLLTYNDWGIDSTFINNTLNRIKNSYEYKQINTSTETEFFFSVIKRVSDKTNILIQDKNAILDLNELPHTLRKQALTTSGVTSQYWSAPELETAPMNVFLELPRAQVNNSTVKGVYSRREAISFLENVYPVTLNSGVNNPSGPNNNSYFYPRLLVDHPGRLITFNSKGLAPVISEIRSITQTSTYADGKGIEMFVPVSDQTASLDTVLEINDGSATILPYGFDIFCYYLNSENRLQVATKDIHYTLIDNLSNQTTSVIWLTDYLIYKRFVRSSRDSVFFTRTVSVNDLIQGIDVYNGRPHEHDIGMQSLYVWFAGRFLAYGIDFVLVNHKLYVLAKLPEFSSNQSLTVLYIGIPDKSLKFVSKSVTGFIKHGKLLEDNVFDLPKHRYSIFSAGGCILTSENQPMQEPSLNNIVAELPADDGQPFCIQKKHQFIRRDILDLFCATEDYEQQRDELLSNFLSSISQQSPANAIITITQRYELVSPMISRLVYDLTNNIYQLPDTTEFTYNDVIASIQPYLYLLEAEPIRNNYNPAFAIVTPIWGSTSIPVTLGQYNFVQAVNRHVLENSVENINLYLTIIY